VRPCSFATSGSSLTKPFQTTYCEGGVITGVPFKVKVIAPILTYPNCTYTVSWRKFIRHVVLGYCFSFANCHCCERNFEYLNWLSTRTCGAGRPHVWLCHAPLVYIYFLPLYTCQRLSVILLQFYWLIDCCNLGWWLLGTSDMYLWDSDHQHACYVTCLLIDWLIDCFQSADRRQLSSARTMSVCQRWSHVMVMITAAMEVMKMNFVVRLYLILWQVTVIKLHTDKYRPTVAQCDHVNVISLKSDYLRATF